MNREQLNAILYDHAKWLKNEPGGKRANLSKANLVGACLDPSNNANADWPGKVDEHGVVIGYRSLRFGAIGGASPRDLKVGETVKADVFSVSDTECHPGIYLWPTLDQAKDWAKSYSDVGLAIVKVSAKLADIHHAGTKWRAKEITVLKTKKGEE